MCDINLHPQGHLELTDNAPSLRVGKGVILIQQRVACCTAMHGYWQVTQKGCRVIGEHNRPTVAVPTNVVAFKIIIY